MTNYRRDRTAGATWFFTVAIADRKTDLLIREIDRLRAAVRQVREDWPFHIDAWVVLPDHMHALWTLPRDDHDFSTRWRLIKSAFSRGLPPLEPISPSRANSTFSRYVRQRIYGANWGAGMEVHEKFGE